MAINVKICNGFINIAVSHEVRSIKNRMRFRGRSAGRTVGTAAPVGRTGGRSARVHLGGDRSVGRAAGRPGRAQGSGTRAPRAARRRRGRQPPLPGPVREDRRYVTEMEAAMRDDPDEKKTGPGDLPAAPAVSLASSLAAGAC